MIEYCHYCARNVDLDEDVEHWMIFTHPLRRDKRCKVEIEDICQAHAEGQIKGNKVKAKIGGSLSESTHDPRKHRLNGLK